MRLSRLIYLGLNHHAGAKATYFLQAIKYTPVTLKLHTEQNVALLVLQVYSYLPDSSGRKPSYLEDVEVKSACHDSRFHVKTMQVLTFHIM